MKTKHKLTLAIAALVVGMQCLAQNFDKHFSDSTLRVDYIFAGSYTQQAVYVDELCSMPRWHGRRNHLAELPLNGNGQITMRDAKTGEVIYRHSFSTLFQEWLTTDEAKRTSKSFENVFLLPYPKHATEVTVTLCDNHGLTMAELTHTVDPTDILIRRIGEHGVTPYETLQQAADTMRAIDIAFVAEGYTEQQMDTFLADARTAAEAIFSHEPFKQMRQRFNVIAVKSPSPNSGTSEPANGIWRQTALKSHFDTFYSDRYLTTLRLKQLHDILAGTPYEHIIILVNTAKYGGGGIYNSYNLSFTKGRNALPVVVHEFGHSFGGLADEYEYGDGDPMYFKDVEPWEPNITTKHDFSTKWQDMMESGEAGLIEGGGYQQKGVWRAFDNCRMRTNEVKEFCPVCQRALTQMILFCTE